jgi:UDP-galactopyranose mutase
MKPIIVVGAGWSGATVAHCLTAAGHRVEVLERADVIGGHSRVERLNGVIYEPNGAHILHTENENVARFFGELGLLARPFRHRPRTEIELADGERQLMSWPIQVDELETLPDWKRIERELAALPERPSGDDFETYSVSLMGRRLYELFIEHYTRKQWGRDPSRLSSSFAPKRIDLRRDGNRNLFRDRWEFFPPEGVNSAIESLLRPVAVTCGADTAATDLFDVDAAAIIVTAAVDEFIGTSEPLEWRGVHLRSRFYPDTEFVTPAYVVNRPAASVPYTRTIETKHATRQDIAGTVVSEEYPGADARHYPVADVHGMNERRNGELQAELRSLLAPTKVFFCGRLATYRYINQDEAIAAAWHCASEVIAALN